MKKIINLCFLLIALGVNLHVNAQNPHRKDRPDKKEWLKKMQEFKHGFLSEELDLTEEQAEDFFTVYDEKEKEVLSAERLLRQKEREVTQKIDNGTASNEEIDECIEAQHQFNAFVAEINKKYETEFRKHLTRKQLFMLPRAERKFMRVLMERRNPKHPPKPNDHSQL